MNNEKLTENKTKEEKLRPIIDEIWSIFENEGLSYNETMILCNKLRYELDEKCKNHLNSPFLI